MTSMTADAGWLDRTLRWVEPTRAAAILFGALAAWGTLGAIQAAQGAVEAEGAPPPDGVLAPFALDGEYNAAAILSALYWVFAAATLYRAGQVREPGRQRDVWTALAVGLVYLALDEAFGLHEKFEHRAGIDWELLYLPLLLALAAAGLHVFLRSPRTARLLLGAAGSAAVTALVLEAVQWDGDTAVHAYRALMVPEEILEAAAGALIAVAGLVFLRGAEARP